MKLKSIVFGVSFVLLFYILIPILLIIFNVNLNFPVINNLFLKIIGLLFILVSLGIIVHSFISFKKFGKGTPVPIEPPEELVIEGLYGYTRNPIYLAYMMFFLAAFLVLGYFMLLIYFFIVSVGLHLLVVLYEEPKLIKRFGKSYHDYTKKIPRWF